LLEAVFSPDSRVLATGDKDGQIRLWDAAGGSAIGQPMLHVGTVTHLAFSTDGKHLLSAGTDGTARVWECPAGRPLSVPLKHGGEVTFAAFSPDGGFVVTAGTVAGSGEVRVWDTDTGQPLSPVLRQGEPIAGASFSPEGDRLATSNKDGIVRIWDIRPDSRPVADLLLLARFLSGRKIHAASGNFVPFDRGDLRQSWPQLRARFPAEFGPEP